MAATITGRAGGIARHRPPVKATGRTVATGNRTVETFYCTVDATDRTANSTDGEAGLFHRTADGAGKCFGMRFYKDFAPDGAGNSAPVVPGRAAAGVVFS